MKRLYVLHWLAAAAIAASLPVTARAMHGMGGFAGGGPRHSMGGFAGGGPRHSMGGFAGGGPHHGMGGSIRGGPHAFMGGGPHAFMGPRVGGFGFRHEDPFFAHRFAGLNQFFPHNRSL